MAITSTRPAQLHGYFNTVFDARLTDHIDETISGVKFNIRLLRVNLRHHSWRSPRRRLCRSTRSGRGCNTSTFRPPCWTTWWTPTNASPPSGSTWPWEPTTHQGISTWATPVGQTVVDKPAQFKIGARPLLNREGAVPELSGAGITHD